MSAKRLVSRVATHRVAAAAILMVGTACSVLAPEEKLELAIETDRTAIDLGESVRLLGIAYNPSAEPAHGGRGCSPGIGFYATRDGGAEIDLYEGLGFLCPTRDDQTVQPGETDSVSFNWTPPQAGAWSVRSALVGDGPLSPSSPLSVTVR